MTINFVSLGAKSKRRNFACLFFISSFRPEITKRRSLSFFCGEIERTKRHKLLFSSFRYFVFSPEITKRRKIVLVPKIKRGPPHYCKSNYNRVIVWIRCEVWSPNLTLTFNLLTPKVNRGPSCVMINICMKYHHRRSKRFQIELLILLNIPFLSTLACHNKSCIDYYALQISII